MVTTKDDDRSSAYNAVVNVEGQYSIWLSGRTNSPGWRNAGTTGRKQECFDNINRAWTDMRPLSLRKKMERRGLIGDNVFRSARCWLVAEILIRVLSALRRTRKDLRATGHSCWTFQEIGCVLRQMTAPQEFSATFHLALVEYVRDMKLGRALGDPQCACYLLVREALPKKTNDFLLSCREKMIGRRDVSPERVRAPHVFVQHFPPYPQFSLCDRAHDMG